MGMGRLESMDRELQRPLSDVSLSVVDCNPGSDSRDDSSICAGDSSSNVCNGDSGHYDVFHVSGKQSIFY